MASGAVKHLTAKDNVLGPLVAQAMAGAMGFATEAQARSTFGYLHGREADIFYEGQVREIPAPTHWEETRFISGQFDENVCTDAMPPSLAPHHYHHHPQLSSIGVNTHAKRLVAHWLLTYV